MYTTTSIDKATPELLRYCAECEKLGYNNNSSLKALKFEWCLDNGMWHGTFNQAGDLVALSGIHLFKNGFRALFRGAQLEARPVAGLNRYQMQSFGIADHLPLQIEYAMEAPVYITTNVAHDASGRMNRIHKSFSVMEKHGEMVRYRRDEEIFNTVQSIWEVNVENYNSIRKRY